MGVCLLLLAVAGPAELAFSSPAQAPLGASLSQGATAGGFNGPFGFGTPATEEEIAAWDIDVRPDGTGLPAGSGTVAEGAVVYAALCSECHGETATEGPYNPLVIAYDADNWPGDGRAIGTIGPDASTVYDYINRTMPFNEPKSLSPDEVYAVTAWLLNQNGIIAEDAVMDADTLPQVEMPALEKWGHRRSENDLALPVDVCLRIVTIAAIIAWRGSGTRFAHWRILVRV